MRLDGLDSWGRLTSGSVGCLITTIDVGAMVDGMP
jgi:hypothetical protein